ncbi:hypothetical protein B0A55_02273 [Friedmanniomyces simplex]|uniref:N-acetyltransferase domain-containing protein n=1 Tax=Friedmanniomyces simplex TaxID=329884 RepID=A0A4U0XMJ2_9PEZI|nr:hypothetical protein B0A55_02273 [Friedmanniomyces simplex]
MPLPSPILYHPSLHSLLLPHLAQMHADCVLHDGTVTAFLPNQQGEMDVPKILDHWAGLSEEVERGVRVTVLQFTPAAETEGSESELMGFVSLSMPVSESGPFRAGVEKLLVSPQHRRKGVARRVMGKLEEVAREKGRVLLVRSHSLSLYAGQSTRNQADREAFVILQMLETIKGSGAEHLYPKLGYKEVGVIPRHSIHPHTRELVDEMLFYKDLRG